MTIDELLTYYLKLGFTHVVPMGMDHILFVLSLFFLNSNLKSVAIQCTLFTLAHSITLGLTATGHIRANENIIEPLIAISIVITSVENLFTDKVSVWRNLIILLFGLIHGMGFASALQASGLADDHITSALVAFNIGVELGQLAVLSGLWLILVKWVYKKSWYKTRVVYPACSIMACIGMYWAIDRIFVL